MARLEELIDRLGGAKFITMLDLVPLDPFDYTHFLESEGGGGERGWERKKGRKKGKKRWNEKKKKNL